MLNCIVVGIGGFIGAVCRYLIGLIPLRVQGGFPVKTLIINIIGAFAIGLITAVAAKRNCGDSYIVLMLKAGVCGGFTTFSTFAFEVSELIHSGSTAAAVLYALLSMILGTAAVFTAQILVKG
ncbi:fluoride efflux transporter CrcB [Porcipelethomonas sp.]|uniref:fluoride efflux transporter CrcB n=1 Tax=Porcipelethomonas sp. TaxID=2981675 RepID=UPI003EF9C995